MWHINQLSLYISVSYLFQFIFVYFFFLILNKQRLSKILNILYILHLFVTISIINHYYQLLLPTNFIIITSTIVEDLYTFFYHHYHHRHLQYYQPLLPLWSFSTINYLRHHNQNNHQTSLSTILLRLSPTTNINQLHRFNHQYHYQLSLL